MGLALALFLSSPIIKYLQNEKNNKKYVKQYKRPTQKREIKGVLLKEKTESKNAEHNG